MIVTRSCAPVNESKRPESSQGALCNLLNWATCGYTVRGMMHHAPTQKCCIYTCTETHIGDGIMTYETIITQQRDAIFEIIFNREEKRNAINWKMMEEISQAMDEAEKAFNDGTARVVFFRANGVAFSSGIDLNSFLQEEPRFGANWKDNLFATTSAMQH